MEASVGMRETVTSLKFKEGEALSKHNLKERDVTTTLPLCGNEKAAHFVVIIKNVVYITKERKHFTKFCILDQVLISFFSLTNRKILLLICMKLGDYISNELTKPFSA